MPLARSLWDNSVGPEGAKALGEALTINKTLKTLEYAAAHPFSQLSAAPDVCVSCV